MQQLELFPLNLIEQEARNIERTAIRDLLWAINDAHGEYVIKMSNRMYADHVIFDDSETITFTIVPEFWPDMASEYMMEAHPTMYDRIVEGIDNSFAV